MDSKRIIVVAPHPDDETLGCGGALLRHIDDGDDLYWLIVTGISEEIGYSAARVKQRDREIRKVAKQYGFCQRFEFEFSATHLDQVSNKKLVERTGEVFRQIEPSVVYLPYRGDIHTDHAHVFDAVSSCTKWFRYPSIRKVLAYETISETEFAINPDSRGFRPNYFVDISGYLDDKIDIMKEYDSEVGDYPFPRSSQAIKALANYRGSSIGTEAAEAFMLLRQRVID